MSSARTVLAAAVAVVTIAGCGSGDDTSDAGYGFELGDEPVTLLDAEETTILGQPIRYPEGTPQITSTIITLQPGEETGWHRHDTPLYGFVLAGSLTVDYGDDGERQYEAGDALIEAIGTSHNGRTNGDEPVHILVVNIGSDTAANTVLDEQAASE